MVNQICSPNSSTIECQKILDNEGFEDMVKKYIDAAAKKATPKNKKKYIIVKIKKDK